VISLDLVIRQVCEFLLALSGNDAADVVGEHGVKEQISYLDYHERLYRLGTGWLGWPPEVVWSATPAEILEAQKGRVEMLKAVFGGKQEDGADETITESALGEGSLECPGRQRRHRYAGRSGLTMPNETRPSLFLWPCSRFRRALRLPGCAPC